MLAMNMPELAEPDLGFKSPQIETTREATRENRRVGIVVLLVHVRSNTHIFQDWMTVFFEVIPVVGVEAEIMIVYSKL